MSLESHISQLEQRHRSVESTLDELQASPSASDEELRNLKRAKLRLKDKIAKLQTPQA